MTVRKKKTSVETEQFGDDSMEQMLANDSSGKSLVLPSKEKLSKLSELVERYVDLEGRIELASTTLKELTRKRDNVQLEVIPDLFDELGMSKFALSDGTEISIKRGFVGSITAATKKVAFDWLGKNGHDSIIKHDFVIKLKKGEKEQAKEVKEELELLNVPYSEKEHIHHSTLKAFVNEQMDNGTDIPQEAFNIFPIRKAIIK